MQKKIENEKEEYEYYKKWAEEYSAVAKDMYKRIGELKKMLLSAKGSELIVIQGKISSYLESYRDCTEIARELLKHADIAKYRKNKN